MYDELFLLELLEDTHFILTLIFGVILSAAFVGMERTKANYMKLGYFTVISAILQFLTFKYLGNERALQLYPLLIHVPLIIFLSYMYKVSYYSSTLATSWSSTYDTDWAISFSSTKADCTRSPIPSISERLRSAL